LAPPLQVQILTVVPLAVAAPVTSRQRPDSTPTIVPSAFTVHLWLAPPLQSKMVTAEPGAVACAVTSRHFVP
jgi:hypothetical protein